MEVNIHVTEQCNLNCKACFHMIPISINKNYYWYIEHYIRPQLQLLARHKNIVDSLVIMGGEPTLHPHIISILYVAREIFPDIPISIATNGSVVNIFENDLFIKALLRNNIKVSITEYPYSQDASENYEKVYNILKANNVPYSVNATINKNYYFLIQPFRKDIDNDITKPTHCKAHHYCTMLKNGKLWVCHLAAYVDSLKAKFPDLDWINVDDGAYVDLEDNSITDQMILDKMASLSTICKHCVELHRPWYSTDPSETTLWGRSEGKKEEWVRE